MKAAVGLISWLILFAALSDTGRADPPALMPPPAPYRPPVTAGRLFHPGLVETSGLAPSRLRRDLLWAVNDSGNTPTLFAVGLEGQDRGTFRVAGAENRDWEDLASFRASGTAYLMIADVGDNQGRRETCTLYIVAEPVLENVSLPLRGEVPVFRKIRFQYADGPRDCEAVAIDPDLGLIFLLTKRTVPPAVYGLLLSAGEKAGPAIATRLSSINTIPAPSRADLSRDPVYGRFSSRPTAMDISPDGSAALVLTYRDAYRFVRFPGESWPVALARLPERFSLPRLAQAEAACFGPDGETVFVTTEKRPAPLLRLERINGMEKEPPQGDLP